MMQIALLGTRGVPARYGGFETAAEEIGRRLAERGHDVVVYCRNPGQTRDEYLGMRLVNLPAVRQRAAETLSHTMLSVGHAIAREHPDVAIVFNAANAPFLPALRLARIPVAVHVDGLEWKRAKWGVRASGYYRWAEASQRPLGRCRHRRCSWDRRPPCATCMASTRTTSPTARRSWHRTPPGWPRSASPRATTTSSSPASSPRTTCGRSSRATQPPGPRCRWSWSATPPTPMPTGRRCTVRPPMTPACASWGASGTPTCSTPCTPTP